MAGGVIKDVEYYDYAKVEIAQGENKGKLFWFVSDIFDLKVGDLVFVEIGGTKEKATVVRIDKNISSRVAPIPSKHAKHILSKV